VIFANLRRTLLLTNVLVMATILIALGAGILLVMDRVLVSQEAAMVERDSQRAVIERGELSQDEFRSRHTSYTSGTFYTVWDGSGKVTFNPSGAPSAPLAAARSVAGSQPRSTSAPKVVPFFIEELLEALLELGYIEVLNGEVRLGQAQIVVPDTIEGAVLARIDRLPAGHARPTAVRSGHRPIVFNQPDPRRHGSCGCHQRPRVVGQGTDPGGGRS